MGPMRQARTSMSKIKQAREVVRELRELVEGVTRIAGGGRNGTVLTLNRAADTIEALLEERERGFAAALRAVETVLIRFLTRVADSELRTLHLIADEVRKLQDREAPAPRAEGG